MHSALGRLPPLDAPQPAHSALWRHSSAPSRQQCYNRHLTATTYQQADERVAADALIRELVLDPADRQPQQPALTAINQQAIVGTLTPLASTRNNAQCSAAAPAMDTCTCAPAQRPQQQDHGWQVVPRNCIEPRQEQQQEQFSMNTPYSTAAGQPAQPGNGRLQQELQQDQQLQKLQHAEQQQQLQETNAGLEYQQNICRSVRGENCSSVEQLVAVIAEHGPFMDGQAVTACFTAAARLGRRLAQQQQHHAVAGRKLPGLFQLVQVLEQQLLPLLQPKLHQLDAQGLQMVLYSLASLQYKQEVLVLQLEVAVTPVVHHLLPGRVCQLVWSLGQLGAKPNGQLVKTALRCSGRCMSFLQGQDLCQLLQGLVLLQLQPHLLWLDACCARVLQLCAHQRLQPRALCSILHNLACLVSGQQQQQQQQDMPRTAAGLPQPLMQQLMAATQQVLESAAAAGAAHRQQRVTLLPDGQQQALQSCNCQQRQRRQQQPPAQLDTIQQVQQQDCCVLCMQALTGRVGIPPLVQQEPLVNSIQMAVQPLQHDHGADAGVNHQRQQDLLQQDGPRLRQGLAPAGLVTLADALRRLKADPPSGWQVAYIAAARQLMHSSDARNLPLMLAPCVRWRRPPGQDWVQQYLELCEKQLPFMHKQGIAVLGHSLAALQVQPSPAWLVAYMTAADSCRLAAAPAGCSFLMHTLGAWRQLGCLPQQQEANSASCVPAAAVAEVLAGTGSTEGTAGCIEGATSSTGPLHQDGRTAAAEVQLPALAHTLACQCLRCFLDHGHSFTAEQLGMFCKGLAQWRMRGTPQLASRLEQVLLQHVSHQPSNRRRRRNHPKQRLTATTLCSVLLALAVACPEAATPALLSLLWTTWSAWLLPMTTPAQAAAVAWAVSSLRVQPSTDFAQGLLQQLAVAAGDSSVQLQHLAIVLLETKQGGWQMQPQQARGLLQAVLHKQAAELLDAQQQQQQATAGGQLQGALNPGKSCSCDSKVSSSQVELDCCSSSNSSSTAAARLYGLANHRLKGWITAGAAVAAWCDVMSLSHLQLAVDLYSSVRAVLPAEQQGAVEAHLRTLRVSLSKRGSSSSREVSLRGFGGGNGIDGGGSSRSSVSRLDRQSRPQAAAGLAA